MLNRNSFQPQRNRKIPRKHKKTKGKSHPNYLPCCKNWIKGGTRKKEIPLRNLHGNRWADEEILTVCNADTLEWDSPYGDKSQLGKKEKGKPCYKLRYEVWGKIYIGHWHLEFKMLLKWGWRGRGMSKVLKDGRKWDKKFKKHCLSSPGTNLHAEILLSNTDFTR